MQIADKNLRLINFIIDIVVIMAINMVFNIIISLLCDKDIVIIALLFIFIGYYYLMEVLTGKTIGKIVTGTHVHILKGKNRWFWLLMRTLLRFNPLDTASYLCGTGSGTHDVMANTVVCVDDKRNGKCWSK